MTVSGTITTPEGVAVLGTSVVVKGSPARGVVADVNGNYSIQAAKGEVLVFSCLGYETKEVSVSTAKIDVILQEDSHFIEETVVVGYSPMRKSDDSLSVNQSNALDFIKIAVRTADHLGIRPSEQPLVRHIG